ncbi:LapA family protein, partial [Francisella tularensis subsp. holarctica]|nr:LapA family protein [Francisella tularensis subsp. holarctica]
MFDMLAKLYWQIFFGILIILIVILSILNTD